MHTEIWSRLRLFFSIQQRCNSSQATNPKISIRMKREAMKAPIPLLSQPLTNHPSHQLRTKFTITSMWSPTTGQTIFVIQIKAPWCGPSKREASIPMLTLTLRCCQAQSETKAPKDKITIFRGCLLPQCHKVISCLKKRNSEANPGRSEI